MPRESVHLTMMWILLLTQQSGLYKVLMCVPYFYNLPCLLEVDSRVLELAVELCPHCLELYVLVSPAVAVAARDDV